MCPFLLFSTLITANHLANAGEFNRRYLRCQISAILYADRENRNRCTGHSWKFFGKNKNKMEDISIENLWLDLDTIAVCNDCKILLIKTILYYNFIAFLVDVEFLEFLLVLKPSTGNPSMNKL